MRELRYIILFFIILLNCNNNKSIIIDKSGNGKKLFNQYNLNINEPDIDISEQFEEENTEEKMIIDIKNTNYEIINILEDNKENKQIRKTAGDLDYYYLVFKHSGKCIEVGWAKKDPKTRLFQQPIYDGENEKWAIIPHNDDYVKIINKNSSIALSIENESMEEKTNLIQDIFTGKDSQLWKIEDHDEWKVIINKKTGMAVSVSGKSDSNGAKIVQTKINGNDSQKINFVKAWDKDDFESAINYYQKEIDSDRTFNVNYQNITYAYYKKGDLKTGDKYYNFFKETIINEIETIEDEHGKQWKMGPLYDFYLKCADALLYRSKITAKNDEKNITIKYLKKAFDNIKYLENQPDYVKEKRHTNNHLFWRYLSIGEIYGMIKEHNKAIKNYNMAIKLSPDNAWGYVYLGGLYGWKIKDFKNAVETTKKALLIRTDFGTWMYNNLIHFYRSAVKEEVNFNYDDEINFASKIILKSNNNPYAVKLRAVIYELAGKINEAEKDYTDFIKKIETNWTNEKDKTKKEKILSELINSYNSRAGFYKNTKSEDKAIKDYEKILELKPDSTNTIWQIFWVYWHIADWPNFVKTGERFLSFKDDKFVNDNEYSAHHYLSQIYYWHIHNFQKALYHAKIIDKKFPDKKNYKWKWWDKQTLNVKLKWELKETDYNDNKIELMLPVQNNYQKHIKYKFNPSPKKHKIYKRFGNTFAELIFTKPETSITAEVKIEVQPVSISDRGFGKPDPDDTPDRHIGLANYSIEINPYDPKLKTFVNKIIGNEKDQYKKAKLIHDWMMENFTYIVTSHPTIWDYLEAKTGECGGYATVFTALCRTAGIPARTVYSPIFDYPEKGDFGSHATSEFFIEELGWVPVDNTGNSFGYFIGKLALNRSGALYDPDNYHTSKYKKIIISYFFEGIEYKMKFD